MAYPDQFFEKQESNAKTILVVDDDPAIGEFLVEALTMEARYHVLFATNGTKALEITRTVIPDLFLLDYQLPGMNGLALAVHFSANSAFASIPIVLMSANMPKVEQEKHPINFIKKPFGLDELLQMIEQLLAH
ncbi:MAG TPA: response regulator [Ktedonobacteraceae bacterium]